MSEPLNILLVEDNPGDVKLIEVVLSETDLSFVLETVGNLADAEAKFQSNQIIDIVLLDLGLPESQGKDTFEKIKEYLPKLPLIVLTGLSDSELGKQLVGGGVQDYLIKGRIDSIRLESSINYAIERHNLERKLIKSEEQLLQSQKMEAIGQLAGGVAHDFNNLLTSIVGNTQLAEMDIDEPDKLREYFKNILKAASRAEGLTLSLLTFSRKQIFNMKVVDLNNIARESEQLIARIIGEDIEFIVKMCDKPIRICADEASIEQVILNLATNARDAMPSGGSLSVELSTETVNERFVKEKGKGRTGDYACVTVTDTGTGMADETVEQVFMPFFTTKSVGKGTGLGLSIVYGIIENHDGFIDIVSKLGRGTKIRVFLPLAVNCDETDSLHADALEEPTGGHETILLAEDETAVRELVKVLLVKKGYKVLTAINGADAVKVFKENIEQIDLLLFDVIMPIEDGKSARDSILAIKPGTKTIFMTGYASDELRDQIKEDKLTNVVSKPFVSSELLVRVRSILDKK